MTIAPPPTGRTIVLELVAEMEDSLYPLLYRTLAPSTYHVYLHPDDYHAIEAIVPLLIVDAQKGLNARVDELNNRSRLLTMVTGKQAPIEIPAAGWEIHLQPDANDDVAAGDFRIESRLSVPATPTYHDGTQTVRIGTRTASGTSRQTIMVTGSSPTPPPIPQGVPTAVTSTSTVPTAPSEERAAGFARLSYVDELGPHTFAIKKDLVAIGRGGSTHWVDVQVVSTTRVSRVHCRIRRDAQGRFFLQDVSTWGTSVDGRPVPPFARRHDDRLEETGQELELRAPARIQLADAVVLEFQVPV